MPNLVGTSLNQVPTNSMLGGLAYQDPEHASIKNLDLKNLSQINSEIADTAVDIFIYDTSKDSDGGAWRKRTQHTSWYNETLNTAVRGSRKEFPAVAVLVAESNPNKITIYDGDDPDLPMWMVFTWVGTSPISALGYNNRPKSATKMINGQLVTCGDPDGLHTARFVHDDVIRYTHTAQYKTTDAISKRTNSYTTPPTISTTNVLIASTCNDVAVTVLPNSPIDEVSGLPRLTIAVATNSGLSVVTDGGNVVDITSSKSVNDVELVYFDKSGRLYFAAQSSSSITDVYQFNRYTIPSYDISNNVYSDNADATYYSADTSGASFQDVRPNFNAQYNDGINEDITSIVSNNDGGVVGNVNGLSLFVEDYESQNNGMVAYAATSYNTGYMHGDCKGAFLSDTDTTNTAVAYSDGFSNTDKGWAFAAASGSGGSITGGNLVLTQNSQARAYDVDALDGVATGTKLVFTFIVGGSGTGSVLIDDDGSGAGVGGNTNYGSFSSTGSYIFTATKTASNRIRFYRQNGSNDYEFAFLNITTEYDRSVNDKGLTSNGTVNKSVVATGAELVGYGPFSSANYVKQLYNSDMNFGTGDVSITWWHYMIGDVSNAEYVYDRAGGNGNRHAVYYVANDSGRMTFYTNAGTTSEIFVNGINAYKDQWTCYTVTRSGSSGDMAIYINGEVGHYAPAMVVRNLDNTSAELYIGQRHNQTGAAAQAKYALMRFSKSIPSPEQIKKMYNDEKVLFQPNAKATLYGSSDAVTGLAFDDTTNLLHVGTSAGRSEFQGLRRINNTTEAVTTAISVSNGLVAEQ